jgi:thymidylate synthase (FAD)
MHDPEQIIAKLSNGYTGVYDGEDLPQEKVKLYFEDQMRTKLHGPMEMLFFVFLVKNVSRAMTHQFVRTRLASFVQESMRFMGSKDIYNVLISTRLSKRAAEIYTKSVSSSVLDYEELIALGTSSEDARGVLPTNIMTSLYVGLPLNSLQHVYEQRMCCQAQPGEWQPMLTKMKEAVRNSCGENVASLLSAPYERGEACGYRASYDRPCVWSKNGK